MNLMVMISKPYINIYILNFWTLFLGPVQWKLKRKERKTETALSLTNLFQEPISFFYLPKSKQKVSLLINLLKFEKHAEMYLKTKNW